MSFQAALLHVLTADWRTYVTVLVLPVVVGKAWPSDIWPSGDHGLLFGSVAYGVMTSWLIVAAVDYSIVTHISQLSTR